MTVKMYTTNQFGEYCEKEIFQSNPLSGAETLTENFATENSGFLGFGVALTGSSCYNLAKMEKEERHNLLKHLYTKEGLNLNVARLTIGSSDYSAELYTYDDVDQDIALKHFSIARDLNYIIPIVKEIAALNPKLKFYAAPWTPPAWMKTGHSIGGGFMREQYIDCYADYFVKYIQAYKEQGIEIYAVTPQNEPLAEQGGKMPSCLWHPDTEAKFILALKKKFDKNNIQTKIWCFDHGFDQIERRVEYYLNEYKELPQVCDGVAFHYYDACIEDTEYLKNKFQNISFHLTEGGPRLYDHYDTDWCKWGLMIVKSLKMRYSSFTGWNLMLDETGGPNVGPFPCGGFVTRNSQDGSLSYSGQYKAYKHFAHISDRSIIRGLNFKERYVCMAYYPKCDGVALRPEGCVIENPKNTELVLVNPTSQKAQLQYMHKGKYYYFELLPDTLATVIFED